MEVMSELPDTLISVLDNLIFAHALINFPITNLMKYTYWYDGKDFVFPPDICRIATTKFQNYKRAISKNTISTEQRIQLLDIDHITSFDSVVPNHYLKTFAQPF